MKTSTTLIALSLIASLTFSARTQPSSGGGTPEATASLETASLSHGPREIPANRQPWFADYPLTIDIDNVRIYASDPARVLEVQDAIVLFAAAGLELPYLEIWTHDDLSGCRLTVEDDTPPAGVYFQRGGVDTIFLCGTSFTLLHELAHAHDVNFLSDKDRDEFLAIRDADSWQNEKWARAAGEHFADVVAWGISGGTVRPSRTFPNDNASLDKAFELAAGFGA
jgi:hypothetical protein